MNRRVQALRNLAERPGTPAEGEVAREKLKQAEAKAPRVTPNHFIEYLRQQTHKCACGFEFPSFLDACPNVLWHEAINRQMHERFPRGTRVYYNYWAYSKNCPARVTGFPKDATRLWGWINVKFDHLKNTRSIPIYSSLGCHLSTEPIPREKLERSGLRGGMENFDAS